MARKTPQELRRRAKKLLEEADKLENKRATAIGKLVIKHEKNDFRDFDLESFKAVIRKM